MMPCSPEWGNSTGYVPACLVVKSRGALDTKAQLVSNVFSPNSRVFSLELAHRR
jgi:hypothetical protein